MHKILCFFGIHKWTYADMKNRQCDCCGLKQVGDVDEMFMQVFWSNVKEGDKA